MLTKPDIQNNRIVACLRDAYRLPVKQVTFLPLGADRNTAVYRAVADDGTQYFVKLRGGVFDETAVALSKFLSELGIKQVVAPVAASIGTLWVSLGALKLTVYPYVEGHNGFEVGLSDRQWRDLGIALKRVHTAVVPRVLARHIKREAYSPQWREKVKRFLESAEDGVLDDPVAARLAAFLRAEQDEILDLVGRAERLVLALRGRSPEFVLCHSDIHAGNILIDTNDSLHIVDWDNPIMAPKERDLMFIGGGQGFAGHTAQEEEALFYEGYGQTQIDPVGLAYYRYERIIEDIAVFCEQLFLTDEGKKDREQSLRYLTSNFLPGGTIEIARASDKASRGR